MNGLLTQSNRSWESFESAPPRPPSIVSFATNTSTDTIRVQGIGTLAGRMIFAVGEVALRGIEHLTIRRRLSKVMSAFPHNDEVGIGDIETIYDHTLELSRFGLYPTQIRKQALQALLIQIATRKTRHLLRSLVKWPPVEIALFLSEILMCMPEYWLPPCVTSTGMHRDLMEPYLFSQPPSTNHQASPMIDFIMTVAQVNWPICQAVFNSGFFDMLVCIYACNFTSDLGSIENIERGRDSITDTVCVALATLCCQPEARAAISGHPVGVLWPTQGPLPSTLGDQRTERQAAWRRLSPVIISRRLSSIKKLLCSLESTTSSRMAELPDAQIDLLEFSRGDLYGLLIAHEARTLAREFVHPHETHCKLLDQHAGTSANPVSNFDTVVLPVRFPSDSRSPLVDKNPVTSNTPPPSVNTVHPHSRTWSHDHPGILVESHGTTKDGTVPALVEQLLAHERVDSAFTSTFFMTFKSFTTLDAIFDLAVQRFWLQPPQNGSSSEVEKWKTAKQRPIQLRVLHLLKYMVAVGDVIDQRDRHILRRMREFVTDREVYDIPGAKQLLNLIDCSKNWENFIVKVATPQSPLNIPTASISSSLSNLHLINIDTLEIARQLTIMESSLYLKIKPMECFQRSRQVTVDYTDSISLINRYSDQVTLWVQDSILSKDLHMRPTLIHYFIAVAEECRCLQNYSSMVAIIMGLNAAPVQRLKRSWELVSAQYLAQLGACEAMIDSHRNFKNYHQALATISPPCVPYIGVFLRTLLFIQKGSPDFLPNDVVNFTKHRRVADVIIDIRRWQSKPHNFHPVPSVLAFLEESLQRIKNGEFYWNLSLMREPPESWGDRLVRLSVEKGIL